MSQLEDIHFYIFFESKSITIADKVVNTIFESTDILKTQPEVYKTDKQKTNNDGSFRVYSVYDYAISYQITEDLFIYFKCDILHENQKNIHGRYNPYSKNI